MLLICLPPNSTHLFQPLDVCIFKPFKQKLIEASTQRLDATGSITIGKEDIGWVLGTSWDAITPKNVQHSFKATGLYPPDYSVMRRRLDTFRRGGSDKRVAAAEWLKVREFVRGDILILPPGANPKKPKNKRKTVTTAGRLLSRTMLETVDDTTQRTCAKKVTVSNRGGPRKCGICGATGHNSRTCVNGATAGGQSESDSSSDSDSD